MHACAYMPALPLSEQAVELVKPFHDPKTYKSVDELLAATLLSFVTGHRR
jgi:hypothetical protein